MGLTPPSLSPLAEARKGRAYLQVARDTFERNRDNKNPYIIDLEIESGPLLFLIGHAAELILKSVLRFFGVTEERLKNFKGFAYEVSDDGSITRKKKQGHRRHNVAFLFRLVRHSCHSSTLSEEIENLVKNHRFYREKYEYQLEELGRPTFQTFCEQLELLNSNYDSPFRSRYFREGLTTIPESELLLIGFEYLAERLDREFFDYAVSRRAQASQ